MAERGETSEPPGELQDSFARIEDEVGRGTVNLSALGFHRLLRQIKVDAALSRHWSEVVGRIDRTAFERWARPRFPVWFGNLVLLLGTLVGVAAIVVAANASDDLVAGVALVASAGILSVSTHDLAHWAVGRLSGIRFLGYFLDGPFRIQPGIKIDYASYLRAPPGARATMHASGALASKVAPFVSLAFWPLTEAPAWSAWAVAAIGVVQIVSDVAWSTKKSDWKKVARERRLARAQIDFRR